MSLKENAWDIPCCCEGYDLIESHGFGDNIVLISKQFPRQPARDWHWNSSCTEIVGNNGVLEASFCRERGCLCKVVLEGRGFNNI